MHKCAYMSTLCIRTQVACPPAPRELPRASAFAGVHLVRLWDTGVIRNVGRAAAVVGCSSARGDHESSASHFPVSASVTDRSGNVWHSALDASTRRLSENWPALMVR